MKELAGKVAVVTGGASGIGLALAHRFAAEQMKLVLLDIEADALAAAEEALRAAGATVLAIQTDVSRPGDLEAAAARAQGEFGTLHVICNNAGVGGTSGPMWSLSEADWEWAISVNLRGVTSGIRVFLGPLLASGEEGHIINTASIAGLTSNPFMGTYTATKHAVVALSEVLAKELELTSAPVGVSVLCPGFVRTQIASSERNRPAALRSTGDRAALRSAGDPAAGRGAEISQAIHQLVQGGQAPKAIAEHVLSAIRERRFYILTHPEMRRGIEVRLRDILEERAPGIDPIFRQLLGK